MDSMKYTSSAKISPVRLFSAYGVPTGQKKVDEYGVP